MNEKIKELAEQAKITFTDYGSGEFLTEDDISLPRLEKFAELIIRECVGVAVRVGDCNNDIAPEFGQGAYFSADQIKQHFGVE